MQFSVHILLHIVSLAIATFMVVVSWTSFLRARRSKILLLAIAFLLLDVQQLMEFFEVFGAFNPNLLLPLVGVEVMHSISFATIALFAAGVLKQ
jgi:hypothetical protein